MVIKILKEPSAYKYQRPPLIVDHEFRNASNNWKNPKDVFNKMFKREESETGMRNGGGFMTRRHEMGHITVFQVLSLSFLHAGARNGVQVPACLSICPLHQLSQDRVWSLVRLQRSAYLERHRIHQQPGEYGHVFAATGQMPLTGKMC